MIIKFNKRENFVHEYLVYFITLRQPVNERGMYASRNVTI